MIYPYTSPFILTDQIYADYGGHLDNSTSKQRDASFFIAERQVSQYLETYLMPTTITGTYLFRYTDKFLTLDNTYVNQVVKTSFLDTQESVYWSQLGTANVYVSLRDAEYGLVDIHYVLGNCNGCAVSGYPYKVQEVYNAGFSSATSYQADILLALTTYADIILNEIIGYGNETSGDAGVQKFSNQGYNEERFALINSSFGNSPRSLFIRKLLKARTRPRSIRL
jgi:hypothetical protein